MSLVVKSKTYELIEQNTKEIRHVVHLSDIHIQTAERVDEYRYVFAKLFKKLKALQLTNDDTVIVVTGDIIHDKTRFTKDSIDLLMDFFLGLSSIATTFCITGSNDFDGITPVIRREFTTKYPIHVLLDDRVYEYNNILFGVTTNGTPIVTVCEQKDGKTTIALHHGILEEAENDEGVNLSKSSLQANTKCFKADEFKQHYDFVLLGGNHKHSYLDDQHTVIYAGSLIQQDFGEDVLNHGFELIDIIENKTEFHTIKNRNGKLNVVIDDDGNTNVDIDIDYPENMEFRIFYNYKDRTLADNFCKTMTAQNIKIVDRKDYINYSDYSLDMKVGSTNVADFKSKDSANNLINEYISDSKHNLDDVTKTNIMAMISSTVSEMEFKADVSCKLIKLEYLEFKNLMIYGDGNHINFDKCKNIVGLSGEYNTGKSAIIDILAFAIYGECIRGQKIKSDIIRLGESDYKTVVRLDVNGTKYIIERIGKVQNKKVKKKGSHINQDPDKKIDKVNKIYAYEEVIFIENGNSRNLTPLDARSEIDIKICLLDVLKRTAIVLQNDEDSFISLNDKRKKDMSCKLFGIELFNHIATKFNSKFTTTTRLKTSAEDEICEFKKYGETIPYILNNIKGAVIKSTQDKDVDEDKLYILLERENKLEISNAEIDVRIDIIKRSRDYNSNIKPESIDNIKMMIAHERTSIQTLNNELSKRNNEVVSFTYTLQQYDDPEVILKRFNETKIAKLNKYTSEMNKLWKTIVNNINTNLTEKQVSVNETAIATKLRVQTKLIRKIENELQEIQDRIDDVSIDEDFEEEYNECLMRLRTTEEITKLRLDKERYQLELLKIERLKINDERKQLGAVKNNMLIREQINGLRSKINELISSTCVDYDTCNMYRNFNNIYGDHIESTKNLIIDRSVILKDLEDQLRLTKRHEKSVRELSKLVRLMKANTNELQSVRNEIEDQRNALNISTRIHTDVLKDNDRITKLKAQCDEYEKDIQIYSKIIQIFGDKNDGIVSDLLSKKVMPKLESIVNQLYKNIDNSEMSLSFKDGDFSIHKKDTGTKIYMNGKYVNHIMNLILRIAMMQINSHIKTNFIIIDEMFDMSNNKQDIIKLVEQLKVYYDFALIISYDPEIKARYDQTMQIDYNGESSRITV